jgi:hypothetical protein
VAGRQRYREAKVENFDVIAVTDKDVCRLDIAVNDASGVCRLEGIGDLDAELDHPTARHRAPADDSRKHLALEQLHHNEMTPFVLCNLVNGADIRVVQARCGSRLVLKSRNHPEIG